MFVCVYARVLQKVLSPTQDDEAKLNIFIIPTHKEFLSN